MLEAVIDPADFVLLVQAPATASLRDQGAVSPASPAAASSYPSADTPAAEHAQARHLWGQKASVHGDL